MKHTPGPWKIDYTDDFVKPRIWSKVNGVNVGIAICDGPTNTSGIAEIYEEKANAQLISAAPDLLRELRSCLGQLAEYAGVNIHNPPAWFLNVHSNTYDAIKKAKGEEL